MKKKLQVFISSTDADLLEERQSSIGGSITFWQYPKTNETIFCR